MVDNQPAVLVFYTKRTRIDVSTTSVLEPADSSTAGAAPSNAVGPFDASSVAQHIASAFMATAAGRAEERRKIIFLTTTYPQDNLFPQLSVQAQNRQKEVFLDQFSIFFFLKIVHGSPIANTDEYDVVLPRVDSNVLEMMISMGFSDVRARKVTKKI